ncbi:hypothetical protein PRK78_002989 [Emydomyces testavorans]|uniref:DUF7730 domain-containing protein n=1 Tax=Emydomyces testavorans TaxID=2070801 RepID=A0AAF0II33_9EURO|nr:hypothetical protein PRK78_002989 [Emydomyces testavorans]
MKGTIIRFRQWIRTKLRRKCYEEPPAPEDDDDDHLGLPALPLLFRSRRSLPNPSPSFSRDHDIAAPDPKATAGSAFFRLPPELRHMIYMFAFGGHTIHMDLQPMFISLYPAASGVAMVKQSPEFGTGGALCATDTRSMLLGWTIAVGVGQDPYSFQGEYQEDGLWAAFSAIYRLIAAHAFKEGKPQVKIPRPENGRHGFSTRARSANTIHTSSNLLMLNFPSLIPPQHLNSITSLELSGKLYLLDGPPAMKDDQTGGWPAYESIIATIESNFASLQRLYLAIHTGDATAFPGQQRDITDIDFDRLWNGADRVARKFGKQLETFEIAPQASVYYALEDMVPKTETDAENATMQLREGQIWRSVHSDDPEADKLGYWITRGTGDYIAICTIAVGLNGFDL